MNFTQNNQYASTIPEKIVSSHIQRLSWADHARGFAIILVAYRHVAIGMRRSGIQVNDLVYNFHELFFNFRMPVFFVLSGIFTANSLRKRTYKTVFKDKIYTLLYPYLLWGFILMGLEILFSQYTNSKHDWGDLKNIFIQPRMVDHLWYLFALFNVSLIFLIFSQVIKNKWIHGLIAISLQAFAFLPIFTNNSLVLDAFYFYPFYFIGTLLSATLLDESKSASILNVGHLKWLLPAFIAGQSFWLLHRSQEETYFLLFFLINLIACYLVYTVFYQVSKRGALGWLAYMGSYSLYIYILHVPVAAILRILFIRMNLTQYPGVIFIVCWVGGLLIPIVLFDSLKSIGFRKLFSLKTRSAA